MNKLTTNKILTKFITMAKFSRIPANLSSLNPKTDPGISVQDALILIENSEYKDEMLQLFDIKSISNDFIKIVGASTLVSSIIEKDEEFIKTNIDTALKNVSINQFNETGSINLKIKQEDKSQNNHLTAETIYSAKSDFLDDMFNLGKFTEFCTKNKCNELIDSNIEYLKTIFGNNKSYFKRYKILTDKEGVNYLRAITSTGRYHDYNIRVSVFIALITLHLNSKVNNQKYRIRNFIYSESYINVYFENETYKKIGKFGHARYVIELSNDEVKKEALKFSGVYNIYVEDEQRVGSFFIKPNNIKSNILSINHSSKPSRLIELLKDIQTNSEKVETEMFNDIVSINSIKDPDQIRHLIKTKIDNAKTEELQKYKTQIATQLFEKINNIYELLKLMDKIYLIISESDIEAKEYLMYLLYDSITQNNKEIIK